MKLQPLFLDPLDRRADHCVAFAERFLGSETYWNAQYALAHSVLATGPLSWQHRHWSGLFLDVPVVHMNLPAWETSYGNMVIPAGSGRSQGPHGSGRRTSRKSEPFDDRDIVNGRGPLVESGSLIIDPLGVYTSGTNSPLRNGTPCIVVCIDRIARFVAETTISLHALYAKILAHEFGHAFLDDHGRRNHYGGPDPFCRFMEETSANLFARIFVQSAAESGVLTAQDAVGLINFMHDQPSEYALGAVVFEHIAAAPPVTMEGLRNRLKEWQMRKDELCTDPAKAGARGRYVQFVQDLKKPQNDAETPAAFDRDGYAAIVDELFAPSSSV